MKKRLFAAFLGMVMVFALLPATALAAPRFTLSGEYAGYSDVDESKWYGAENEGVIRDATLLGIMEGDGTGFRPDDNIKLSEVIKMAAVVYSTYHGSTDAFDQDEGEKWFDTYVGFAVKYGIIGADDFTDYERFATRAEMAYIFAHALPESELAKISTLVPPDVSAADAYAAEILMLYAVGVLQGNDESGAFTPTRQITRAEAAAIITRMAIQENRQVGAIVTANYASDELLAQTGAYCEFIEPGAEETGYMVKAAFTAALKVLDFKFVGISLVDGKDGVGFKVDSVLYEAGELLPEKPLVIGTVFHGDMPTRGVSFVDGTGTTRYFGLTMSGEDGSLLLIDLEKYKVDKTIFNCNGLTAAIPNEYLDQLKVIVGDEQTIDSALISVYEKASIDAAAAHDITDSGVGWVFSLIRYDRTQYEQYLCSDGSGLSFFAKDNDWYYGYAVPTDVRFYPGGGDDTARREAWDLLCERVGPAVRDDFITRNGLSPYSDEEARTDYTYAGAHQLVSYYPYYSVNGSKDVVYTLVLSQPVRQGEGGVWCVERWYDSDGTLYYYFPSWGNQTDMAASEYYAALQTECDDGHRPGVLDPIQTASEFAAFYFGHTPTLGSFELTADADQKTESGGTFSPADVIDSLFASGDIALTLNLANDGAYNTYLADAWYSGRFKVLLDGYKWAELAMPLTEPSDFWLTAAAADGAKSMTFWANSGAGMVQYNDGNITTFWSASPANEYSSSIALDVRHEYDNLDVDYSRIAFYLDGSAEAAADSFVHSAYGSHMISLAPGNMYGMSDYDVAQWEVREVSADGDSVVGSFQCVFTPWDFNSSGIWAGNTAEGTGEYAGKLSFYREFVLQRQEDGYWHCIGLGTGGYSLPE